MNSTDVCLGTGDPKGDTIDMPSHLPLVLFLFSSNNSSVDIFLCFRKYSWSDGLQRAVRSAVS